MNNRILQIGIEARLLTEEEKQAMLKINKWHDCGDYCQVENGVELKIELNDGCWFAAAARDTSDVNLDYCYVPVIELTPRRELPFVNYECVGFVKS